MMNPVVMGQVPAEDVRAGVQAGLSATGVRRS
jgi:hypothetical protein